MPYRRTDNVARKLAARHRAILAAAEAAAAEGGIGAVQIGAVAARAGIATGTVYRYFPSKAELVTALVAAVAEREIAHVRKAAGAAPGPLSALAAALTAFAARALRQRRLAWALLAEPVDAELAPARTAYRQALVAELRGRIAAAMQAGYLPAQDAGLAATAVVGALLEGLLGPLAPNIGDEPAKIRDTVQAIALVSLRALGVVDARARGLVAGVTLP